MFNFAVNALYAGGRSPYSAAFESIATRSLEGVQSANIALIWPREDEFFWDGAGDRQIINRPRVDLSFSYFPVSGVNEQDLGFTMDGTSCALNGLNDERNYYVLMNSAGQELTSYSGFANNNVFALGNGVITRYGLSAGVGQATTVSAAVECLNALIQPSGSGQPLPSIYKQVPSGATGLYALPFVANSINEYRGAMPGSIVLSFNSGSALGAILTGGNLICPLQSFSFDIQIPRAEPKELGWAYPNARPIQWPVTISIHADAYLNGIQSDALNRFSCADSGYDFSVSFQNGCANTGAFSYRFAGAKLDNESVSVQVSALTRVTFDWSLKIMDPARTASRSPNFYLVPSSRTCYASGLFPQVDYVSGQSPLIMTFGTCCYLDVLNGAGLLDMNQLYVTDDPGVITLRVTDATTAQTQDVTITVA